MSRRRALIPDDVILSMLLGELAIHPDGCGAGACFWLMCNGMPAAIATWACKAAGRNWGRR